MLYEVLQPLHGMMVLLPSGGEEGSFTLAGRRLAITDGYTSRTASRDDLQL